VREHGEELVFPAVCFARDFERLLALDGDGRRVREQLDQCALLLGGPAVFAEVQAKRGEDVVGRRQNWCRPRPFRVDLGRKAIGRRRRVAAAVCSWTMPMSTSRIGSKGLPRAIISSARV
jgi:hypothetical protein